MNSYKPVVITALALFTILSVPGCRKSNNVTEFNEEELPTVTLLCSGNHPELDKGISEETAAHRNLNRRLYKLDSHDADAGDAVTDQVKQIESSIENQSSAIILIPADAKEVIPAIKKAVDAKVPVISVGPELDANELQKAGVSVSHVAIDVKQAAMDLAAELNKIQLPGSEVLILGNGERKNFLEFHDGFMASLGKGTLQVVAAEQVLQGDHNTLITAVQMKVAKQLKDTPELAAVLCCDFTTTQGALRARAAEQEKEDGHAFAIFGFATNRNFQKLIKDGATMLAVEHHDQMALRAVAMALESIQSDEQNAEQEAELVVIPIELVPGTAYSTKYPPKKSAKSGKSKKSANSEKK